MFNSFKEIVENRHEHIKRLKAKSGKKIIGYLCSYVPEELIWAAGAIPFRLLSNEEAPILGDTHMQSHYCAFARNILHQGLKGEYHYLDGLVWAYTCTTMRLTFEIWERNIALPFIRFMYMPCIIDAPEAKEFYITELRRFRRDLEDLVGHPISDNDLRRAIAVYDTNRSLVMELFEFRKADPPLLSGTEAYEVTLSSMLTDKEEHNALLGKLFDELPKRADPPKGAGRLMIVGSPMDNLALLEVLESEAGGIVVTDDTCTGTRYFYGTTPAPVDGDPLEAIAERYLLSRVPCPAKYSPVRWTQCISCPYRIVECLSMAPRPRRDLPAHFSFASPKRICRFRHILQLAASHRVEGAIIVLQKFCDTHSLDYPHIAQLFKAADIPTLLLEVENIIPKAQVRTRTQAFLEILKPVEYLMELGKNES